MTFGFSDGSGTSASTFLSPVKYCLQTDKTGSIERQDLEPRQRICDCHVIHHSSFRTLWSAIIKSPIFLLEVLLRQCVFCEEPLLFWFSNRRRNLGICCSELKYSVYLMFLPLLLSVPNLSLEKLVRMQVSVSSRFCERLQPFWKISQ